MKPLSTLRGHLAAGRFEFTQLKIITLYEPDSAEWMEFAERRHPYDSV
uniref:Uncharacterized protein n=1 Tax=Candidatus Kentrum sp. FW TaxID=2126338 RepID=A0A450T0N7_9GAMM|nr:MAG: hypothetical protein BECKFW1821B_GA0114236_105327 [Candidatus Kentron sp. FW]